MENYLPIICLSFVSFLGFSNKPGDLDNKLKNGAVSFTENKGQISDQNYNPRPDVLFSGATRAMLFHLRTDGISYQLSRMDSWKYEESHDESFKGNYKQEKIPDKTTIYRLDINWLNINSNFSIENDEALAGYNNYYLSTCPNGALQVKSYKGVTFKNIYNKIDLHYYERKGDLKYDYIVQPNADYKQIQLEVKGAEMVEIQKDGSLLFKTPLGTIIEAPPLVLQNDKPLQAKWVLKNKTLSFEIVGNNKNQPLIIDPLVRLWGTYFGGTYDDVIYSCATDLNKNLFVAGYTDSQTMIATSGGFQTTFGSPGSYAWNKDAFLAKFDSAGTKLWGTYYGDYNYEEGRGVATDALGNVYLTGEANVTGTQTLLATSGAFQTSSTSFGGFLVKFNSSGARLWGTYYCGTGVSCAVDGSNNVYMYGVAYAQYPVGTLATVNSHQTVFGGWHDCFLAKFTSSGIRLWSTYYGGGLNESPSKCYTDFNNNVYVCGTTETNAGTGIATSIAYQSGNGGYYDAFLAKFDSSGVRQWGTYYGGTGFDWGYSCYTDQSGNIYLTGTAGSGNAIADSGSYQTTYGGAYDAFLVKFNSAGVKLWSTYYGGAGGEEGVDCLTDLSNNVYLYGKTGTGTGTVIASLNGYQTTGSGNWDAYMVKFDSSGVRSWGTYYSGSSGSIGTGCAIDLDRNLYIVGITSSTDNIASYGCYQDTINGWTESFIAKLSDCSPAYSPINLTPLVNQITCVNTSATLTVGSSANVKWYNTILIGNLLGTGTVYITPTLSVGNYSFYAQASTCTTNIYRTLVTLTVVPLPTLTIVGNNSVCQGSSISQIVNGSALTYTWSNGLIGNLATLTPSSTTIYTVVGTDINNCKNSSIKTISVNLLPILTLTSSSNVICSGENAILTVSGANFYTWDNGFTGPNLFINPLTTNTYTVIGTNINGCNNSISFTQNVDACTGINSISGDQIVSVFPNPNAGVFTVRVPFTFENEYLEIYNSIGQLVYSEKLFSEIATVNLNEAPQGLYFIKIRNNTYNTKETKIIKK